MREQGFHETESRDYCPWPRTDDSPSNPLFDRLFSQKLHFLLGTLLCEVKPTTSFAVIRERFAIWLKVQLPRAAILDCSSFFPMIDLSLTLFRRLLQCLSCYSKGRIAMNLFSFLLYIYLFFFFKWKFNPRPCKQENCASFERYLKFRMFLKDTWVKRNTFVIRSYRVQRKLMLKGFYNRCRRLVFMVKIFAIFHAQKLAVHLIFIAL